MIIFSNVDSAMAVLVLLTSFGIGLSFNVAYLATPMVFPVIMTASAFGICNAFARGSTIIAPLIAELEDPIPAITLTSCSAIGALCSLFI